MKIIFSTIVTLSLAMAGLGQSTTAGNLQNAGQTNYLGYSNNLQLLTKTFGINRMKVNGNVNYAINGYPADPRNGNVLIGQNNNDMGNANPIYTARGAFSLLHLNGPGTQYQQLGYKPWMQTGVSFTGNRDFAYFGLRQVGTIEDHSETVLSWADNGVGGSALELVSVNKFIKSSIQCNSYFSEKDYTKV